jgi:hypothetical protein
LEFRKRTGKEQRRGMGRLVPSKVSGNRPSLDCIFLLHLCRGFTETFREARNCSVTFGRALGCAFDCAVRLRRALGTRRVFTRRGHVATSFPAKLLRAFAAA